MDPLATTGEVAGSSSLRRPPRRREGGGTPDLRSRRVNRCGLGVRVTGALVEVAAVMVLCVPELEPPPGVADELVEVDSCRPCGAARLGFRPSTVSMVAAANKGARLLLLMVCLEAVGGQLCERACRLWWSLRRRLPQGGFLLGPRRRVVAGSGVDVRIRSCCTGASFCRDLRVGSSSSAAVPGAVLWKRGGVLVLVSGGRRRGQAGGGRSRWSLSVKIPAHASDGSCGVSTCVWSGRRLWRAAGSPSSSPGGAAVGGRRERAARWLLQGSSTRTPYLMVA